MDRQKNRALIDQELIAIDGATVAASGVTGNVINLTGVQTQKCQLFAFFSETVKDGASEENYFFTLELSDDEAFGSVEMSIDFPAVVFPGLTTTEKAEFRFGFVPNFHFARLNPQVSGTAPSAKITAGFAAGTV